MTTNPQELARVRAIHRELDARAAAKLGRPFNLRLTKSNVTLSYTEERWRRITGAYHSLTGRPMGKR